MRLAARFITRFLPSLGALCLSVALLPSAQAARLAFVVGNDQYQHISRLNNAVADAQTMAGALRKAGYQVSQFSNQDLKALKDELRAFRRRVQGGDEVVLYFSGHGVQLNGENYLLPVDVRADNEDQVRDDALGLSALLADLRNSRPAFTLAIIDACRNNPFAQAGRSIGGRGLTRAAGATGEMILFAAGEGQQALDRLGNTDPVRNGLFTRVFVKEMERPGVPVDQVLKAVRVEVHRLAQSVRHEQVPALYDQVLGSFYFYPPGPSSSSAAVAPLVAPVAPPAPVPVAQPAPAPVPQPSAQVVNGRYQILAGGSEVKDLQTGLVWQRCSVGQNWNGQACAGEASEFKFDAAQQRSGNGWRVPTVRELHSLIQCSKGFKGKEDLKDGKGAVPDICVHGSSRPTLDTAAFPNTPSLWFWTSSPLVGDSNDAWSVSFLNGYVGYDDRDDDGHVRLVR